MLDPFLVWFEALISVELIEDDVFIACGSVPHFEDVWTVFVMLH